MIIKFRITAQGVITDFSPRRSVYDPRPVHKEICAGQSSS